MSVESQVLTRSRVITLAIPIMLANAAGPLVGLVDTAVIGQLGDKVALAAIALGAAIYGVFYWGFGFLRMSTAGLAAQASGQNDQASVQAHLARAVPLGFMIGAAILALQFLILPLVFKFYQAEVGVESAAGIYLMTRLWGLPATLAGIALMGWFIGIERPRRALYMQIVLNVINAVLSVTFVLGLGFGVFGVALASVFAEWAGLLAGLYLARREIKASGGLRDGVLDKDRLLNRAALSKLGITNSNIFIRTLTLTAGFQFFYWHAANQGAAYLAGTYILMHFINMIALVLDSFAHVAEAAVGAAYGAGDKPRFKHAVRLTTEFAAGFALIAAIVIYIAGPFIIDLITTEPDVRAAAKTFLPYCAMAPVAGFAAWQLDGIFIGVTRTAAMRNAGIASVLIYFAAHFAIVPILGLHGIWIAFLIYYVARAVTLAAGYPALMCGFEDQAVPTASDIFE